MHCAGPSGLFGREFVSVDRSVNKHSFRLVPEVYRGCYDVLRSSTYGSAEVLSSVRCELILIGLPLPLLHQLILSLLGIGLYSGTELVESTWGIHFLYLTDEMQ